MRAGLRGSLDTPLADETITTQFVATGWVAHFDARVLLVVLTVDGEVVGTAMPGEPRPDVAQVHAAANVGGNTGWSATLDVPATDGEFVLRAHALVQSADGPSRTVLLEFGKRTLFGAGRPYGSLDPIPEATPGVVRVGGDTAAAETVARVEVSGDDGETWVRARIGLPGPLTDGRTGGEASFGRFEGFVRVPAGAEELVVRAAVVTVDGERQELPSRTVKVVSAPAVAALTPERAATLAEALARRVDWLSASTTAAPTLLVAAHDLGVGGAQLYLDLLLERLHAQGVRFCVVASGSGPLLERIERDFGAPVLLVGPVPRTPEEIDYRVQQIAAFGAEHRAYGVLANTLVTFPAVLAAGRLGIESVWAIHESFDVAEFWCHYLGTAGTYEALTAATHTALAETTHVVFEATSTRDLYADVVPEPAAALVPYGVPVPTGTPEVAAKQRARQALGLPADARVLLCVGTMEPRKAQASLVRAFARLTEAERAGTHLCLVGASDNAYSRAVSVLVEELNLPEVHVVPTDPDIARWYRACDVLVSASDVESMPRTMLEAMMIGRPVAATAAFGVGELVEAGRSGWLCEPNDLAALTAMMREVVTAPVEVVMRLGRGALETARGVHDAEGYLTRYSAWVDEWSRRMTAGGD